MMKAANISGKLSAKGSLSGAINDSVISKYKKYDGEYEVTPKAFEQTILETKNMVMTDNVTVLEVPYYEVSNTDGTTVYIASGV